MRINIAGGTGLMGKIHKPIFEKSGHEVILSGRNTTPGLEEAARISDLTIVSVPINSTEEIIKRVAPGAKALMDFTSLKEFPVKAMLKYSTENCEVGGLHPLYGEVKSLEGRTVVYCETERSGWRCREVVESLKQAGLKIREMAPEYHDSLVQGTLQNGRTALLEAFAFSLEESGLSIGEIYELSPPPTKILIDLIARQFDERNDEIYQAMRDKNSQTNTTINYLIEALKETTKKYSPGEERHYSPKQIRDWFGKDFLREAQERARRLIS
jgi:hypothetical protein